jgi:hypothetical protein
MGTNYYLVKPEERCAACGTVLGHDNNTYLHIGKSSGGWHFCFDGRKHKTVEEWRAFIDKWISEGGWIADEYQRDYVSDDDPQKTRPEQFWEMVEAKRKAPGCQAKYSSHWHKTVCVNGVDFNDHSFS